MSTYYGVKIGYGYPITWDDYPSCNWDNDEEVSKYYDWQDALHDCDYRYTMNWEYDESGEFFGIMLDDAEYGEFISIARANQAINKLNRDDWEKCEAEYHRLFPNSTKQPDVYIMSVVW